ncbi:MAG TPA: hypothetical protein VFR75_08065 [Solirubrobacterales bacterium]|nr:hypothetical protein [Solirubrobacterales bacterium]
MIDRFLDLVRQLRRSEAGMALPVALFAMISSMALAGTAVVATTDVQIGAHRDDSSKDAIAAADAGANVARVRQTRYGFVLNNWNPCLVLSGGQLTKGPAEIVDGQRWCPPVSGTVGGASYVYQVSPVGEDCGQYELCVVSTGTADEVSRRIEVTYNRSGLVTNESEKIGRETREQIEQTERELKEAQEKEDEQLAKELEEKIKKEKEEEAKRAAVEGFIGRDGITLSGNADIRVGLGTNGHLSTSGNASICGDIRHGVGKSWTKSGNASQCSGYQVVEGNVDLPPVSSFIPSAIATYNSNNRLRACTSTNVPPDCQKDAYTGNWKSKPPFNPTTRAITLSSNDTLTVGGGDYWICSISMSGNSQLIMATGARVRFFFDKPENCGNNGNQLSLSGNNRISATGYQPSLGRFDVPGFYFLGSTTVASQINLSGNFGTVNEMIVYGPDTYINISGNATYKGILVGKQIAMSGNGKVEQDAGFPVPPELNPGATEEEGNPAEEEEAAEEEEEMTPEEREAKELQEKEEREQQEKEKTNRSAIYFTPQAYFECIGLAPAGDAPNANC